MLAAIWPGAAQFAQRRWLAGAIYSVAFLGSLVTFLVYGAKVLYSYYEVVFSNVEIGPRHLSDAHGHLLKLMACFAASILVYLVSGIDAWVCHSRRRRTQNPGTM